MNFETPQIKEFKQKLMELPRGQVLEIIEEQNPEYIRDINRIEWVFRNKLSHINDQYGQPITEKDFTHEELVRLVDPPFIFSREMMKQGFNEDAQRQIHIASDPVLWSKQILNAKPRAYQALVMREPNDQVVLRWGRRLGKALDVNTIIPTLHGYKTMAEIQIGDIVFDEHGAPCNVTDVTEFQYERKCYLVKFSDGSEIVADADHVWSVHDIQDRIAIASGSPRSLQNLTTEQMADSVWRRSERNYSIPLTDPVKFPERELRIHPWVYGYLVCNGNPKDNSVRIIAKDQEEISVRFAELGYPVTQIKGNKFKISNIDPGDYLADQIDPEYLISSIEQRTELMRGICDARAGHANDLIEISLPDQKFVKQISTLLTGLGYDARYTQKLNKRGGEYYGTNHKLLWLNDPHCFSLTRKKIELEDKRRKHRIRYITEITEVESRPVKCIAVDSKSRLFLASESHIPTHNSYFLSMYIAWYAFVHPKARVLVMAPTKAQVALIYDQILELADDSPIVTNAITKSPRSPHHEIHFTNRSTIKFFTTGKSSGKKSDGARGQEADMIVLDEMDYMGSEDLVALMAMLQKTDLDKVFEKKIIGASTPTGQRNTYWRWNTDPAEGYSTFWFPAYINPGWSQEEEDKAHRRYPLEQTYRHEIEADWGEDADGVYPRKYVDIAFNSTIKPYEQYVPNPNYHIYTLGVDWDKHGAGVNIAIVECDLTNPGSRPAKVVFREEIRKGEFTYLEAVNHIVKLNDLYNFDHIYIDQGAGEVQAEMLHKYGLENPRSGLHKKVKACHFSNTVEVRDPYTRQIVKKRLKPYMIDNLVYQLEQKNVLFYPEDDELYLQLISYIKIRETDTGYPVYAPGGETSDHAHDALILALFAVQENYDELFSLGDPQSPKGISAAFFMPESQKREVEISEDKAPKSNKQIGTFSASGASIRRSRSASRAPIKRRSF